VSKLHYHATRKSAIRAGEDELGIIPNNAITAQLLEDSSNQ
jgi:hypothetical protein